MQSDSQVRLLDTLDGRLQARLNAFCEVSPNEAITRDGTGSVYPYPLIKFLCSFSPGTNVQKGMQPLYDPTQSMSAAEY